MARRPESTQKTSTKTGEGTIKNSRTIIALLLLFTYLGQVSLVAAASCQFTAGMGTMQQEMRHDRMRGEMSERMPVIDHGAHPDMIGDRVETDCGTGGCECPSTGCQTALVASPEKLTLTDNPLQPGQYSSWLGNPFEQALYRPPISS